jgi:dipeptidase E
MKLVLYSGGHDYENIQLDKHLIDLVHSESPQITYIPSCSYLCDADFHDFIKQYERFGIHNIINFPIDQPFTEVLKNEVLKSDVIHLSGGNTYYFLKHLRKAKMLGELKKFVKKGGVLTGLSAGAIIMTKTIEMAGIPEFDRDDNDENLKNLSAMNLVDFEFFPHYKNSRRYDVELLGYSKTLDAPIYACPDGSGIVVKNNEISFVGKTYCFFQGKKFIVK